MRLMYWNGTCGYLYPRNMEFVCTILCGQLGLAWTTYEATQFVTRCTMYDKIRLKRKQRSIYRCWKVLVQRNMTFNTKILRKWSTWSWPWFWPRNGWSSCISSLKKWLYFTSFKTFHSKLLWRSTNQVLLAIWEKICRGQLQALLSECEGI